MYPDGGQMRLFRGVEEMSKYEMYDSNELCEICWANQEPKKWEPVVIDYMIINTHCADLRRNRKARKHKNTQPKDSVF